MKKVLISVCAACLVLVLSGCDINPSEFGKDEEKKFAQVISYTKDDRTGLCFAIVASRRTGSPDQTGMGMSEVPCDKVEHLIN